MPINPVSQMMTSMQNALGREYPGAQITRQGTKLIIEETISKDEYNTEGAAEWVDPYFKLNSKTNRYQPVKGYYRQVEKPVSIKGGKGDFAQSSKEEIAAIALGNKNKEYERDK